MNSIIKASDALSATIVRPLGQLHRPVGPAPSSAPLPDPLIAALQSQLKEATARIAGQSDQMRSLRKECDAAYAEGEQAGRKAGRAEATTREAERLEILEAGVEAALATFSERLASAEQIGRLLAREGLRKLVGEDADRLGLIANLLNEQMRQIDAGSVVRIEVSRADFADDAALEALSRRIGGSRFAVVAADHARAGDCRIVLMLGALEVGLDQQLGRLAAVLRGGETHDEA